MIHKGQASFYSQHHFFPIHTLSFYLLLTTIGRTRSQLENLLKGELIDKFLSYENFKNDFHLKFSELKFSISRRCSEFLLQCITQLERNNLNNAQYNRRETLIMPRMSWNNMCAKRYHPHEYQ